MSSQLTALGINIFAGGFTIGVEQAGFEIVGQWEECGANSRTFDLNFGTRIPRPLKYTDWPLLDAPRLHLIYANPPCAVWSSANTYQGGGVEARMRDPRLAMTGRTMETALSLAPECFVSESVCNAYTMGRAYYDGWAEKWLAAGYGVTYYLTDALLVGVPSTRQRFHFMAHRHELNIMEPNMKTFMPRTVRGAIADLATRFGHLPQHLPRRLAPETHASMAACKPGLQLNHVERARREAGGKPGPMPSFLVKRLLWDAPAFTMIKLADGSVHPEAPRYITEREGLRLCGYPDNFIVVEHSAATQAVLPPVGRHIATICARSLDNGPAQRELEIVDHRELAKTYRPGSVRALLEEEL